MPSDRPEKMVGKVPSEDFPFLWLVRAINQFRGGDLPSLSSRSDKPKPVKVGGPTSPFHPVRIAQLCPPVLIFFVVDLWTFWSTTIGFSLP